MHRQLDLFLRYMDADGAPIDLLHMTADADAYVVNDANFAFGNDAWRVTWQNSAITTCVTDVVQRLHTIPTWENDPFKIVDMHVRITLTNTELSRFRLLYAADVDYSGCNMNEEENTFYFNFPADMLPGGPDIHELAPYFAVDFNDPNDSEVGLCVLMSEDDWKGHLTRLVGN